MAALITRMLGPMLGPVLGPVLGRITGGRFAHGSGKAADTGSAPGGQSALARDLARRRRDMVTPEGVLLPLTIASRGARAGALILDLVILLLALVVLVLAVIGLGIGFSGLEGIEVPQPAVELVVVLFIIALFLARYFYFLWFELSPRGATPGKRLLRIRVAARPVGAGSGGAGSEPAARPALGARLTAEAVIVRNLARDMEVFLPLSFLLSGGYEEGVAGLAAAGWLAIFVLFPFFNRDALRAGDLVAGTWVVETEQRQLAAALTPATASTPQYRFGEAELEIYREHELQVLESVLRTGDEAALREVTEAICRKIGWEAGSGDERAFLDAFYAALRAHLERGLRFGRRKRDKFG